METIPPHVFVIFGATGDLAKRKLFPGLLRLHREGLLPEFAVVGSGRHSPGTDEEFRAKLGLADEPGWAEFAQRVTFQTSSAEDGADLAEVVARKRKELGEDSRTLLYLSVPPGTMQPMVAMLGHTGLAQDARLVLEKPFGSDLGSARELNAALHEVFDEDDLFRIDHFLGKEAVQNILVFRFANGLLEPVWRQGHIAYVQIDVPEEIGIEGRASFMEATGTFRDMVSTHLCQLLGFLALEPPTEISAEALRAEKLKLYRSLRPLDPGKVVFGQYEGYRDEEGVADDSDVETFVALEARVDNWRWKGVPFYLRTGKAMAQSRRVITVGFTEPPLSMFPGEVAGCPSELVFELTEEPQLALRIRAKVPGPTMEIGSARMDLDFGEAFEGSRPLEAYERLLLDVLRGDQTLFSGAAEIERLWEVCEPVLADRPAPHPYAKGGWGPQEALDLPGELGWRVQRG
ncbi:glucose-6-phosphate dehydrogenase [Actinokineospora bangkokensis]|uniref:Glucose-6-phosphate 1-dehydrogenase n=1 Tax=Actinokineospora bangkokensis TaxID=1193682 RepID=A0A1Q9LPR6_9PSEU|nr:glucose-6-phosphate dehydrogenase [Actinokineospora bangkokensis]OLR94037.1 glucose-6-phosphate dehydrogenase [Actinokineospora bangkokensis]